MELNIKNALKKILLTIAKDRNLLLLEKINSNNRICVENLENLASANIFTKDYGKFALAAAEAQQIEEYLNKVDCNIVRELYFEFDKEFRQHILEGESSSYLKKKKQNENN